MPLNIKRYKEASDSVMGLLDRYVEAPIRSGIGALQNAGGIKNIPYAVPTAIRSAWDQIGREGGAPSDQDLAVALQRNNPATLMPIRIPDNQLAATKENNEKAITRRR